MAWGGAPYWPAGREHKHQFRRAERDVNLELKEKKYWIYKKLCCASEKLSVFGHWLLDCSNNSNSRTASTTRNIHFWFSTSKTKLIHVFLSWQAQTNAPVLLNIQKFTFFGQNSTVRESQYQCLLSNNSQDVKIYSHWRVDFNLKRRQLKTIAAFYLC